MFVPTKTPKAVIAKLNQALNTTLQDPEVREKLLQQGSEAVGGTPEALGKTVDVELVSGPSWRKTPASRRNEMSVSDTVAALVQRARAAQRIAEDYDQARIDELVTAAGWAIIEPARNRELAELAVADTGIGDVADKMRKNQRNTFGSAARPARRQVSGRDRR